MMVAPVLHPHGGCHLSLISTVGVTCLLSPMVGVICPPTPWQVSPVPHPHGRCVTHPLSLWWVSLVPPTPWQGVTCPLSLMVGVACPLSPWWCPLSCPHPISVPSPVTPLCPQAVLIVVTVAFIQVGCAELCSVAMASRTEPSLSLGCYRALPVT